MSTIYGEGYVADMMPRVTPWLWGWWKPVRVGCYERNYGPWLGKREPVPLRDWWDGTQWRYLGELGIGGVCVRQNQAWRGLTQPHPSGVSVPIPSDQQTGGA